MSSSPSRSPQPDAIPREKPEYQPFPYDPVPVSTGSFAVGTARTDGNEANAAEASAAREALIRSQGVQEGQAESRHAFETQLERERSSLTKALAQFTSDRAAYFQKVEGEVVQLALSIARKILHRESQLDPLLLAGIVSVALEQIDGATGVELRIHPQNAAEWRRYLTSHLDATNLPEIIEDVAQPQNSCTLKTSMGTTIVGVEAQLKEIEQGLMDLLAARPGAPL